MFVHLENQGIKTNRFRADNASYEFLTITTIEKYTDKFYVRARMSSSMDKAISSVKDWEIVGEKEDEIYRGEASFIPFKRAARDNKMKDKRIHSTSYI